MRVVVLAAGEGRRLRPLTENKLKGMVDVLGKPLLSHCFDNLVALDAEELLAVFGFEKNDIIECYGGEYRGVPITYATQPEQNVLVDALLTVEKYINESFMLMLGDNVFDANLRDVVRQQREERSDAVLLIEEMYYHGGDRYDVCVTNDYGEVT